MIIAVVGAIETVLIFSLVGTEIGKMKTHPATISQTTLDCPIMPARDAYHANLINALLKDNWSITDDPYFIKWGSRDMYVDLGASLLLAAEKEEVKIAVELKSFASRSPMNDLENAVGQYIVYHDVLEKTNPEIILYLAVDEEAYEGIFREPIGQLMLENHRLNLVAFDKSEEVILEWIPSVNTNK